MEHLRIIPHSIYELFHLRRVGNLLYFEGPLLSLFKEKGGVHFYLFDWVDSSQDANRWLIYRVSIQSISDFLDKKISHLELFKNRNLDKIYVVDISRGNESFYDYQAYELQQLPANYLPNADNFFEPSDSPDLEAIKVAIALSKQKAV
ncbi:DUF6575 domain-containing protein [Hugenholtzia roseola]|uniref:DUF6575 domain-containing protein n=1 Tax=Hugenholtzia roseola TaxID=1002 RepID=UPI00047A457D|nr:DUF6575 domain-containing protein [Hugenholtzia roseola]